MCVTRCVTRPPPRPCPLPLQEKLERHSRVAILVHDIGETDHQFVQVSVAWAPVPGCVR